jgi:hypothetical protein
MVSYKVCFYKGVKSVYYNLTNIKDIFYIWKMYRNSIISLLYLLHVVEVWKKYVEIGFQCLHVIYIGIFTENTCKLSFIITFNPSYNTMNINN